jgi:hypothetical protein
VYGHWGATTYSGTRSWYAGGGIAGTTASGNYYNSRTGTSGSYNAGRQYNAWTGNATRGYDRTMNGAAGGSGEVARASNYNTYTGQRSTANAARARARAAAATTAPAQRRPDPKANAHSRWRLNVQREDRPDEHVGHGERRQQPLRDVNGNVYKNTGDGWQEHSSSGGWNNMLQNTSSADREAQARSTGEASGAASASEPDVADERRRQRASAGGDRFGGGGFGGWRSLRWRLRRRRSLSGLAASAAASAADSAVASAAEASAVSAEAAGAKRRGVRFQ